MMKQGDLGLYVLGKLWQCLKKFGFHPERKKLLKSIKGMA